MKRLQSKYKKTKMLRPVYDKDRDSDTDRLKCINEIRGTITQH